MAMFLVTLRRSGPQYDLARPLDGRPPDLMSAPTVGCVFAERCPLAEDSCREHTPDLTEYDGRLIACPVVQR